jgi:hypothetical protein
MTTDFTPGLWDVSRADYHADRICDCHSSLEVFRKSVPMYHGVFVAQTLASPGANEAQEFGTAFHTLVLEPEKFEATVCVQANRPDMRTNVGKAAHAEFMAQAGARIVLTVAQVDTLRRMADAVAANRAARELLAAPGLIERAFRWLDPDTGLPMRSMLDKMIAGGPAIDLKTAANPNPEVWAKDAANYGYHRQGALYRYGRAIALDEPLPFLFIVVGKEFPHETLVVEFGPATFTLGHAQNAEALTELRDRKDYDDWSSRYGDRVHALDLPRWAF